MKRTFHIFLLLSAYIVSIATSQGQSGYVIPPGGGTAATREWTQQYLFDLLNQMGISNCQLTITDLVQDESSLSFAINNPIQDVTSYAVEIRKGQNSWFYPSVPYSTGERLTISGIQATGNVLVVVSPSGRPSCYAQSAITLSGDETGNIAACSAGPTITSITQVSDSTLTAQFHGEGVTDIRVKILTATGQQVYTNLIKPTSSIVGLSFPRLVPGNYTLLFEGVNCTGSSTLGFTVNTALAACQDGPTILGISNITATSANVNFHGLYVTEIGWQVKDGNTVLKAGSVMPTSSTFPITYSLGDGTYTLKIFGLNCSGTSQATFTVTGSTPGNNTTVATNYRYVGQTDTTFLKVNVTGSPGNWLLTDSAPTSLESGFEYRYLVNDVSIKGQTKLTNYPYPSNGVVDVKKWIVKTTVPDGMHTWTSREYGSNDNGKFFSPRGDTGGQSIIMFDADDQKPGLAWLDVTPSWYRGEHSVSWPLRAPNMNLPAGKYMMYGFKRAGTDQNQRQAKGETFTPDHTDITKRLGVVNSLTNVGITDPNASRDQMRAAADKYPLWAAVAFEWHEGGPFLPQLSQQERWFVERLRERYTADNRNNYLLMAGYGSYDYVTSQLWLDSNTDNNDPNLGRFRYTGTAQDILNGDSYLGFFNGVNTAINTKSYGTNPANLGTGLIRIAKLQSIKKAGYKGILFGSGFMEILDYSAFTGFGWQTTLPTGGVVQRSSLAQVPFYDAVFKGFSSLWFGDGFWIWDGQSVRTDDKTKIGYTPNPAHTTLLNGATVQGVITGAEYQVAPDASLDGYYIGASLYAQCVATEGGTKFFATFTAGGTTYTAEPDGSDPLTAYNQKRGLCSVRVKGDAVTIFYVNPYAGNSWQEFSVNVYGTVFSGQVFGKQPYIANVSLGGLQACTSGPTFQNQNYDAIYETSTTGTRIKFTGLNVDKIAWNITDNGQAFDNGVITPASGTPYISFNSTLAAGHTYTLSIQGQSCTSAPSSLSFTTPSANAPPVANASDRMILMNITAEGPDPTSPTGIGQNWMDRINAFRNLTYNGVTFDALDGIRGTLKWYEYEPSEGNYQDASLRKQIEWTIAQGKKYALFFWPQIKSDNSWIPLSQRQRSSGGNYELSGDAIPGLVPGTHLPAMYGSIVRQKLNNVLTHLASVLDDYGDNIIYVSFGYGETEEYFLPLINQYGQLKDISGYSDSDLAAWNGFYSGATTGNAPRPDLNNMPGAVEYMYNTAHGQQWARFLAKGLHDLHDAFEAPFQARGIPTCGFFADAGSGQRNWYVSSVDFKGILDGNQFIYSSDGGTTEKLMATDAITSDFPSANACVEFDPQDLHVDQVSGYGLPASSTLLQNYGGSFFRRGGKILHFAMAFSAGTEGNFYNNIKDLAPALYHLRTTYLQQTGPAIANTVNGGNINVLNTWNGGISNIRLNPWEAAGGGFDTRVTIPTINSPIWQN